MVPADAAWSLVNKTLGAFETLALGVASPPKGNVRRIGAIDANVAMPMCMESM